MTKARRIWLTPANAVLALAVMALVVVTSAAITQKVLGKEAAPAVVEPPQPSVSVSVPGVDITGETYTLAGKVRLQPGQFTRDEGICQGPDSPVVVTDKTDALIAYAPLQMGKPTGGDCEVPFTLTVPAGRGNYGVDVPTVGRLDYTEAELARTVELAIG
ncbi:hypothetical protein [Micromonospora sp. NPDC005299]|uniref:hypothetical protein n=1 Tax=Micromonospora sp. NPDC005299 TaxID=3364231 RepID=UPI0036956E93